MTWDDKGCTVIISEKLKNHAPGALNFRFNYLKEDSTCCVARHLEVLMNAKQSKPAAPYFFTTIVKEPFHKATQETLSRYLRATLQELGVDTVVFKTQMF